MYHENDSSLNDLLKIDNSTTVHVKNLRILMCETYKSLHDLNPTFMQDLFCLKSLHINLRAQKLLVLPDKSRSKGTDTNLYRSITVWNSLNPKLMNSQSLQELKSGLNSWLGQGCICKICRV